MAPRKTKRKSTPGGKRAQSKTKPARHADVGRAFEELVAVMARLRAPDGCPWDREQTHATLRTYLIEEAYEVLEAMDGADDAKFAEELGDLLLQVLFHAQIAREEGRFSISDVIREIHEKMIRRHPHVFGEKRAKDAAEVLRNWEIIKKEERQGKLASQPAGAGGGPGEAGSAGAFSATSPSESVLDGIPRTLPALLEAYQLTRKAARIGFDWHNVDGIFDKLREETRELQDALAGHEKNATRIEGEVGDILFVAVNLARFLKLDPEIALKKTSAKFTRRFREMERQAREEGTKLARLPRGKMESLWDQAKLEEVRGPASKVNP